MARHLENFPMRTLAPFSNITSSLMIVVAVFAVASLVSFLCGSDMHFKAKIKTASKKCGTIFRSKPLVKMNLMSWKKIGSSDREEEGDCGEELWKKNILMGERCQPLDFSGKILYDYEGNPVTDLPPKTPVHGF